MKNKLKYFLVISIFFIFQEIAFGSLYSDQKRNLSFTSKNFLKENNYSKNKKNKISILNEKYNVEIPIYLKSIFNNLIVNLADNSNIKNDSGLEIDFLSDNQEFIGSVFYAKGNVDIRSNNAVLKSNSFSFDKDLKILIIEGDIKFRTQNTYLNATKIEYDFINNEGYILNAYGSANFNDFSRISVSKDEQYKKNLKDNFVIDKEIKDVKFNNTSNIKLGNIIRKYEDDKPFAKRITDQSLEVNFNSIVKTRFISEKIEIKDDVWFAKNLTLTNDPFSNPQLLMKNKNFKTIFNEKNTKIRTSWSSVLLENKMPIPLGPRRIDIDKNQNFMWGNGYDKDKYDGFYIFRKFDQFKLNENTDLNITKYFPIQRIITGETKSFPKNEDIVIAPKVKKEANIYDYLGLGFLLKSEKKDDWLYIFDLSTNSLDFEKLDKASNIETYFTVNLFTEDSKNIELKNKADALINKISMKLIKSGNEINSATKLTLEKKSKALKEANLNNDYESIKILSNELKKLLYAIYPVGAFNNGFEDEQVDSKGNYKISKDITFFGSYRDKTKNGSLGEIIVKSAYGVRYDDFRNKEKNNVKSFSEKSFSIGNYESSSKLNSNNLINENRYNFSYKKGYEFPLWKPEVYEFITKEYKFSPVVIPKGLYWNVEGNLDFLRYGDGSKQDLFLIKTGPKLILGDFKDKLFDYTEISILPRFKFNKGESPFNFDQVVDNKAIEIKASQQLYGPLVLNFSGELSLDEKESNNDQLINPVIDLSWERRAYNINLFYNLDSEVGGINFSIHTFNFKGSGEKFN